MIDKIKKRIENLDNWVDKEGVKKEQAHLIKDSKERAYWHYGYLVALKDVLALFQEQITTSNRTDTYN